MTCYSESHQYWGYGDGKKGEWPGVIRKGGRGRGKGEGGRGKKRGSICWARAGLKKGEQEGKEENKKGKIPSSQEGGVSQVSFRG